MNVKLHSEDEEYNKSDANPVTWSWHRRPHCFTRRALRVWKYHIDYNNERLVDTKWTTNKLLFQINQISQDGWRRLGSLWMYLQSWNGDAATFVFAQKFTGRLLLGQSYGIRNYQSFFRRALARTTSVSPMACLVQTQQVQRLVINQLLWRYFPFSDGNADPSGGFMMMAMAWMVMAMMMYFMRPNSLRGEPQGKPQGDLSIRLLNFLIF